MTKIPSASDLVSLDIGSLLPQNVKEIPAGSFKDLTRLFSLDLSSVPQIEIIGFDCFKYLWSLQELNLGPYVKEIKSGSFRNCTSLTRLDLSNCAELTDISFDIFKDCWSLREIFFPEDSKITHIRSGSFCNITSLTRLDLSNCVELTEISFDTFVNAWSLEELILGPNVTEIKSGAFRNLTSLTRLRIPASVAEISWDTFGGCTQLVEVVFEGDTKVDPNAFQNCPRLAKQKRYHGFIYGKYSELKGTLKFEQGEGGTCGITLEGFEDDPDNKDPDIVILPCGHPFREEALHGWLKIKSICPTCKKKID